MEVSVDQALYAGVIERVRALISQERTPSFDAATMAYWVATTAAIVEDVSKARRDVSGKDKRALVLAVLRALVEELVTDPAARSLLLETPALEVTLDTLFQVDIGAFALNVRSFVKRAWKALAAAVRQCRA